MNICPSTCPSSTGVETLTSNSGEVLTLIPTISFLPDVWLCAAVSSQLVLSEVGVVGGRDEVVCQWVFHVLVNPSMFRVDYTVLLRQHVNGESVGGHELVLLGCTGQKAQTQVNKGGELCSEQTGASSHSAFCKIKLNAILAISYFFGHTV